MIAFNIEAELADRPGRERIMAGMLNDGDLFECPPGEWHKAVDFAYGVTRMAIEIETHEAVQDEKFGPGDGPVFYLPPEYE